jgi:predicted transcriptional regulator
MKENHLKLRNRRNIYNYVLKHPGKHFREISKDLKLHKNTIDYHLNYLEKQGLILVSIENGYKRYYVTKINNKSEQVIAKILSNKIPNDNSNRIMRIFKFMNPGNKDRSIINLLRQDTPREIVRFLFVYPESSKAEISRFIKKHHSTVSFYLEKLLEKDIVEIIPSSKRPRYRIKNEDYIYDIYRFYFAHREQFDRNGNPTGKYDYILLDSIVRHALDITPIPFCAGFSITD